MTTPAHGDLVADALLRYYRNPEQSRAEMLLGDVVAGNVDLLVRLALGRPVQFSNPGLVGADLARELALAAVFYFQETLFREGASHYQVLGLKRDASPEAIQQNHRLLIQVVHPDRHNSPVTWPESVAARVNRAYSVLKNPSARAAYDTQGTVDRTKMESGLHAAAAFEASAGAPIRARREVPAAKFPEWLTNGLGGFLRERPAVAIFASLIVVAALFIGRVVWSEREATLTRDQETATTAAAAVPGVRIAGAPPLLALSQPVASPATVLTSQPPLQIAQAPQSPSQQPAQPPSQVVQPQPLAQPALAAPVAPAVVVVNGATARPQAALDKPPLPSPPIVARETVAAATTESIPAPPKKTVVTAATEVASAPLKMATSVAVAETGMPTLVSTARPDVPPDVPPPATATLQTIGTRPMPVSISAESPSDAQALAPNSAEVEALIAAFISFYEAGRLDAFSALFDVDARTNEFRGRAAIRSDYNELFQRSSWRKMALKQLVWRPMGERTEAAGEMSLKTGWRDGREVEQRIAVEMELVRRSGRTVIARLSQRARD